MISVLYLHAVTRSAITRKLAGIYAFARTHDWSVHAIEGRFSSDQLQDLQDFWHPNGVIVECGSATNQFDPLLFGRTPVVFLDRDPKTLPHPAFCVTHDSRATARLAAQELLRLNLAAYAYVPWFESRFWSEEREEGFAAALKLNGMDFSLFTAQKCANDIMELQRRLAEWISGLPKPVGIFAANDDMAVHVLVAANRLKLAVPQEIAVLGVDNNEMLCENTHPTLTSVMPNFEAAGHKAAEMLAARMANPRQRPHTETFGPRTIVRRSSTNRSTKSDAHVLDACDLIRRKACEGLRARDMASLFPCSRRMAEIRFRNIMGHSILDEIQAIRRAKAEELLMNPSLDANAVANFCGYSSANALRNFLRVHAGC